MTTISRGRVRLALPVILAAAAIALTGCSGGAGSGAATGSSGGGATGSSGGAGVDSSLRNLLPASVRTSGTLRLAAAWDSPPVIAIDKNDPSKPVGYVVDEAAAVGKLLGVTPKWRNLAWPGQLPGLAAGNVDALWGQVGVTAEREKGIIDEVPFSKSLWGLLIRAKDKAAITKLADLCGRTLGEITGSNTNVQVKAWSDKNCGSKPIKPVVFGSNTGAYAAVKSGAADAWMDSIDATEGTAKADPTFAAVTVKDSELPGQYAGIAVSKKNPGISKALAGALEKLAENGTLTKISNKWGVNPAEVLKPNEIKVNLLTGTPAGTTVH